MLKSFNMLRVFSFFGLFSEIKLNNNILVFIKVTPKYEFAWLEGNEQLGKTTIEGINDKAQNASQMLN